MIQSGFQHKTVQNYLIPLAALAMLSFGIAPPAWAQNTAYGTNALMSNTSGHWEQRVRLRRPRPQQHRR